eukprot:scaffold182933_cov19-Tisochrysis_lutea.AAC.1
MIAHLISQTIKPVSVGKAHLLPGASLLFVIAQMCNVPVTCSNVLQFLRLAGDCSAALAQQAPGAAGV